MGLLIILYKDALTPLALISLTINYEMIMNYQVKWIFHSQCAHKQ